jgi:hypothetical protein
MEQKLVYTTEQIHRVVDGVTYYAYQPEGTLGDCLPENIVWQLTAADPPLGYETMTMTIPNAGQSRRNAGMWAICYICCMEFPQSEMTKYRGKWYCEKNGCATEAQS